ncbi:MAG: barstar family protein [Planctomycetaceae bacterium]|nr:barstar family protein [Planctomycetaceae bacterium]
MFHYYTPPADFSLEKDAHIATLAIGEESVPALLTDIGAVLHFPPHAGRNFDAFWDCIRDLRPPRYKIILVHQDLPNLPENDLATYLTLLRDAVDYWRSHDDEHRLEVWFPERDAPRIKAALAAAPPE